MICSRCSEKNSEFSSFKVNVDLSAVKNRVTFRGSSWVRRLVTRYVNAVLNTDLEVDVNVCQTCQSRMFRKLDKNK